MRFVLMIEAQQGLAYAEQLAIARRAEAAGFEALFRSDHYGSFPGPDDKPTTDAWTVLAGLARETERIRLGVLVSPVTFRLPGNLAKVVATVDEMSGGRVEVGVGAGWEEDEHRRHGFAFPAIGGGRKERAGAGRRVPRRPRRGREPRRGRAPGTARLPAGRGRRAGRARASPNSTSRSARDRRRP